MDLTQVKAHNAKAKQSALKTDWHGAIGNICNALDELIKQLEAQAQDTQCKKQA